METPKISVVMPVYNGERFLEESVNSILNQTFKDFEFIIINDGSTDSTLKILKKFRSKDKRIVLINNNKNVGVSKSLNIGLENAKGKYIACFCADDISHPKRFAVEFNYLEKNPLIFLVGSSAVYIDEEGNEIRRFRKYDNYKMLAWRLRKSCGIVFPSITFRNERTYFFDGDFGGSAVDYNFYFELLKKGKNLTNIPPFLVKFRVHPGSQSVYNNKEQGRLKNIILEKFKGLKDNTTFLERISFSAKLIFHYIKTINEKRIKASYN
jgi:glycosyltransferase involved in cell wall biosynthesis